MGVELVVDGDVQRWSEAARASGQPVSAFHAVGFLAVAATVTQSHLVPLVVRHGGRDVGVAPWLLRRRGPLARVNRVPFPYAGPLVPPDLLGETLDALWRRGRRHGVVTQDHEFAPGTTVDPRALAAWGSTLRHDQTYVVDTSQDLDALLAGVDPRCRRQVRKAEAGGVRVEPRSPLAGPTLERVLDSVFSLKDHSSGYRHPLGLDPADLLPLKDLDARWAVAQVGEEPVGSLLTVCHEDRAVAWLGGVLPEHRRTNANPLLYWDAIRWAHERGAATLDLSGVPTPEIAAYKKQFGGALVDYPVVVRRPPGAEQARDRARSAVERLRRAAPAAARTPAR